MNTNFETYQYRQPSRVLQSSEEITRGYSKGTYVIMWTNISDRFGIFRCERLKDNLGMNKRHVMNILKAAYQDVTFKSFDESLEFCQAVGIRVLYYQQNDKPTYLA